MLCHPAVGDVIQGLFMLKMAIFVTEKIRYTHRSTYTPFRSAKMLSGFRFHPIRNFGCGCLMSMPMVYEYARTLVLDGWD